MSHNRIEASGATAIANALAHNSSLLKLKWDWTPPSASPSCSFFCALRLSYARHPHPFPRWKHSLSTNIFGPEGLAALAEALEHNDTIERLELVSLAVVCLHMFGARPATAPPPAPERCNLSVEASSHLSFFLDCLPTILAPRAPPPLPSHSGATRALLSSSKLQTRQASNAPRQASNAPRQAASAPRQASSVPRSLPPIVLPTNNTLGRTSFYLTLSRACFRGLASSLSTNKLGDPGAAAIADALEHNSSLTALE